LDEVFVTPYNVLLSYPNTTDENNMNQIQVLNSVDTVEYASPLYVIPPFNAYSAPGVVTSV
jgi:hypothetical protein